MELDNLFLKMSTHKKFLMKVEEDHVVFDNSKKLESLLKSFSDQAKWHQEKLEQIKSQAKESVLPIHDAINARLVELKKIPSDYMTSSEYVSTELNHEEGVIYARTRKDA